MNQYKAMWAHFETRVDDNAVRLNPLAIRGIQSRHGMNDRTMIYLWIEGEAGPITVKGSYAETVKEVDRAMKARLDAIYRGVE